MRELALLLAFSLVVYGTPVFAEPELSEDVEPTISEIDARIAELEADRKKIRSGGSRAAAIVGGVFTGVGLVTVIAVAAACSQADSDPGTRCRKDRARDLEIGFGIAAGAGLLLLIGGLVSSGQKKRQRERLGSEIETLRRDKATLLDRVQGGLRLGDEKMLTLGFRF